MIHACLVGCRIQDSSVLRTILSFRNWLLQPAQYYFWLPAGIHRSCSTIGLSTRHDPVTFDDSLDPLDIAGIPTYDQKFSRRPRPRARPATRSTAPRQADSRLPLRHRPFRRPHPRLRQDLRLVRTATRRVPTSIRLGAHRPQIAILGLGLVDTTTRVSPRLPPLTRSAQAANRRDGHPQDACRPREAHDP